VPIWSKWAAVVIILITTLVVPLALLEPESSALVERVLGWTQNDPLTTAAVLVAALIADVFLPVPNGVLNTLAGSLFGWTLGAVVIWVGLTLGCVVGYGAGHYAGLPLARKIIGEADLRSARAHAQRLGAPTLVVARTVPMFAEVTTMAAGITGYPFARFIAVTGLANVGVAVVFAGIGSAASEVASGTLAFVGAAVVPLLAYLGYRLFFKPT